MKKLPEYSFFKHLFEEDNGGACKWPFYRAFQKLMQNIYEPRHQWGKKINEDGSYMHGVSKIPLLQDNIIESYNWHDFNRLNTNTGTFQYFVSELYKINPEIIDLLYSKKYILAIQMIIDFLQKNINKYFPENENTKECIEIHKILSGFWTMGNLNTIVSIYGLYIYNPNIENIIFNFKTGFKNDMKEGIDLTVIDNDKTLTYQVKTGQHNGKLYGNYYYLNGSTNNLEYTTTYYIYATINHIKTNKPFICIFDNIKNDKNLLEKVKNQNNNGYSIKVNKEIIKFNYNGNMPIPEKIYNMYTIINESLCSFNIINEGDENYINIENIDNNIIVTLNFVDPKDEKLELKLDEAIDNLKKQFIK